MRFGQTPANEVHALWHICREMLLPSFRDQVNCYGVDDYLNPLEEGRLQLWLAIDNSNIIGCVVTSVDTGSAMTICMVHSLAGERLKEWASLMDEALTDFSKKNNCSAIQAVTRRGFSRVFPDFVEDGVIYIRKVK